MRRRRGLERISAATVGLMGRTPDYMNVTFAGFAARRDLGGLRQANARGRRQPGPVPEAPGPRRHLAHPHHRPAHRRQGDGYADRRQPGHAAQGGRDRDAASSCAGPHPGHARALRRRARRLPGPPVPAEAHRGLRALLRHPGRHSRADLPLPRQHLRPGRGSVRPAVVDALRRAGRLRHLRRRRGAPGPPVHRRRVDSTTPSASRASSGTSCSRRPSARRRSWSSPTAWPAHGRGHQRPEPGHAGDAGRAAQLRRGDAQRRAPLPPSTAATRATACCSPTTGR